LEVLLVKEKEMDEEKSGLQEAQEIEEKDVEVTPVSQIPEVTGSDYVDLELPVGSFDLENNYYRKVQNRAINGTIRKKIANRKFAKNPGKIITAALCELIRFPHFEFKDEKAEKKLLIKSMYAADRTACILAIRKATRKDAPIIQEIKCPSCKAILQIQTSPDELIMYRLEETPYTYSKKDNNVIYDVQIAPMDEKKEIPAKFVRFGLARGFEEESYSNEDLSNIAEATYKILADGTINYDGNTAVDEEFYEMLDVNMTDFLFEKFTSNQPGPDSMNEAECVECDNVIIYGIDPTDFLLPSVQKRLSRRRLKKSQ
jgi:hypothetical protein